MNLNIIVCICNFYNDKTPRLISFQFSDKRININFKKIKKFNSLFSYVKMFHHVFLIKKNLLIDIFQSISDLLCRWLKNYKLITNISKNNLELASYKKMEKNDTHNLEKILIDDTYFTKNIKKSQSIPFEKISNLWCIFHLEILNVLFTFTKIIIFYCVREYLNI